MTYEPQIADIGLVPIGGDVGKAIRVGQWMLAEADDLRHALVNDWLDWQDWQHAFVYLGNGELIEAEPGGARIRPLSEYDHTDVYWCSSISAGLSTSERLDIAAAARAFEGTPYSISDYFVLTAHKLHIWLPGAESFINSTHHVICSQLAAAAYDNAGHALFDDRWPGDVDPLDLFLLDKRCGRSK